MADWSPAIANEFIRRARDDDDAFTQMQLQKLVYISHGWNLAINGKPLTLDKPQAWDYGPVYRQLRTALRECGSMAVTQPIRYEEYEAGAFIAEPDKPANAKLSAEEQAVIDRVYRDYGKYHAYKLSALTHKPGTPWSQVYGNGDGRFDDIPNDMIREHFVDIATGRAAANA